MRRFLQVDLLIRLFAPLLLIPLLGLSPYPNFVTRNLQEAKLAENFGSYHSASNSLSEAASFYPWRADLWEKAGLQALKGGETQTAQKFLDKAAALGKLSKQAQVALGDAYFQEGDTSKAIHFWQAAQAASDTTDPDIINRLLQAHQSQKDYPALAEDIKELLVLKPNEASLYYQLGLILAATQPESALAYLEQAANLDTHFSSGANTIQRGINTARLSDEPAYTFLMAGRALASLEEWELAVEAFHQATIARPDYGEAWAFLGEARQHLPSASEQQAQSLSELAKAFHLDPKSIAANSFMGLYWQRLGQPELALAYLENAARLDPSNPAFPVEIGNTLAETGNLPDAQASYQQAIDLAPDDPQYWRVMAEFAIRFQIQLRELALPAAQQAYELDPQDPASVLVLGKTYYSLEEYDRAQEFLQEALNIDPDYPLAHLQLGLNYLLQGDLQNAAQSLQKARELAPDTAIAEQVDRLMHQYLP